VQQPELPNQHPMQFGLREEAEIFFLTTFNT